MLLSADHEALLRSPPGKTATGSIGHAADIVAIHELVALYAQRVTHGLSVADLFVDDGAYIHRRHPGGEAQVHRGRAKLDAHYVERKDSAGAATPMTHNILSRVDGDQAIAMVSIELRLWQGGKSTLASGFYQDRLRRDGDVWKFFEREVTFFHWATPEGQVEP